MTQWKLLFNITYPFLCPLSL